MNTNTEKEEKEEKRRLEFNKIANYAYDDKEFYDNVADFLTENYVEGGCHDCSCEEKITKVQFDLNELVVNPMYFDAAEFERIIEGDIRVGDCFVESNYNNMTENCVVRMITNIDNNDLKYEYCENENNEPYIIGSSVNGISKDDIIEEVESGELLFVGTFDLGSK